VDREALHKTVEEGEEEENRGPISSVMMCSSNHSTPQHSKAELILMHDKNTITTEAASSLSLSVRTLTRMW
jgi:hypothetical protein